MGIYDFIMVLILSILGGVLFYYIVWALAHAIIWSAKMAIGLLSGPARRNLEVVRTQKDLAQIKFGALTAVESIMKKLARADSGYRGR